MKTSGILCDQDGKNWLKFHNAQVRYGAFVANYNLVDFPKQEREIFREHEDRVSRQEFSLIEEVERKIDEFKLSVIWEGEKEPVRVYDVQLISGRLSFRTTPRAVGPECDANN